MPAWLSPVQVVIAPITETANDYANTVYQMLNNACIRVQTDLRNEKIGYKIREHSIKRIPYLLIVGDNEVKNNELSIRTRTGEDLGVMKVLSLIHI